MPQSLLIAAVLSLALTGAVAAQGIGRIVSNTGLTPQDLTIMGETARQLYDVPTPQVGQSQEWSNPESGSFGTTTLAAMTGACASIQQRSYPLGQERAVEYRTRWCRGADGTWVLTP